MNRIDLKRYIRDTRYRFDDVMHDESLFASNITRRIIINVITRRD